MNITPFDDLAIRLSKKTFASPGIINEKESHAITFLNVCRIRYLQMHRVSEKFWKLHTKMLQKKYSGPITIEELFESNIDSIEAKVNYFGFIEELTRFGRFFLSNYSSTIPSYYRIRFYRNKMIEHWDEYEEFLRSNMSAIYYTLDKLVIPNHFGSINRPMETSADYEKLRIEFEICRVKLSPLTLGMPDKYSNLLFDNLEKIDPKLAFLPTDAYNNLINCVFRYGFPTPINDLEEYNQKLIGWMEEFLNKLP